MQYFWLLKYPKLTLCARICTINTALLWGLTAFFCWKSKRATEGVYCDLDLHRSFLVLSQLRKFVHLEGTSRKNIKTSHETARRILAFRTRLRRGAVPVTTRLTGV